MVVNICYLNSKALYQNLKMAIKKIESITAAISEQYGITEETISKMVEDLLK